MLLGTALIADFQERYGLNVTYGEGDAPDKTYMKEEKDFTILSLDFLHLSCEDLLFIEEILSLNSDIVCMTATRFFEDQTLYAIYQELKNSYAHFYQISSQAIESEPKELFIASKYNIENFQFTPISKEDAFSNEGFFDFDIKKSAISVGHFYVAGLQYLNYSEQILEKMKIDFLNAQNENIPFFSSKDLALCKHHNIQTMSKKDLVEQFEEIPFIQLTTVESVAQNDNSYQEFARWQWTRISDAFCKRTNDDGGGGTGYGEYDVSIKKDDEGNVSAKGSLDYSRESSDGSRFSGGIGGEVTIGSDGETKASIDVHAGGRF